MIIEPSISKLLKKVDCRYTLVTVVAKRARQIVNGDESIVDTDETKPVSIALREIDSGALGYLRRDVPEL